MLPYHCFKLVFILPPIGKRGVVWFLLESSERSRPPSLEDAVFTVSSLRKHDDGVGDAELAADQEPDDSRCLIGKETVSSTALVQTDTTARRAADGARKQLCSTSVTHFSSRVRGC